MRYIILLLLFVVSNGLQAQTAKEILAMKPNNKQLVYDFGGFLGESNAMSLSRDLTRFFDTTGTQIVVLTLKDLDGNDPNQFATALGSNWGIGEAKEDNGVLLLLSMNDRKSYIATGRGAEGPLPDILCKRILQEVMKPLLKEGNYVEAINKGTETIKSVLAGEGFKNSRTKGKFKTKDLIAIIFIVVIAIVIIIKNKNGGGGNYMSRRGAGSWLPGIFLFGGLGGGSSGGGGNSGGSGWGDFGGFGGGSFGGGGAGGDW